MNRAHGPTCGSKHAASLTKEYKRIHVAWRTKAALFVSDHISSDFSIPVRQSSHSDASSALLSASRVNSSTSVLQVALLDSISSLQSLCHSESALSALESSVSGPSLSVRSFLRFASATFVSDLVGLELSVPLKSFCVIDFTLFLAGAARMDFLSSLPVLDGAILDFSLLLRSLSHLDFPAPACYSSYLGPLLSIQSHACLDFSTFLGGPLSISHRLFRILLALDSRRFYTAHSSLTLLL